MSKGKDLMITEKQKMTKLSRKGNVHFGDIKRTLQRSSNDKENC